MPGNSQPRSRRTSSKKGAPAGSGGKNRESLKGRGRTLPADERPWHKGYSGDEKLPSRTAWKQDKERRAASAEGRAPKVGLPGTKSTTRVTVARTGGGGAPRGSGRTSQPRTSQPRTNSSRGGGARVAPGRKSNTPREAAELLLGRNPVLEALRTHIPAMSLYVVQGIEVDDRVTEIVRTASDRGLPLLEVTRAELDRMTGGVLHQGVGLQVPPFAYEPFEDLLAAVTEAVSPLMIAMDGVNDPRNLGAVVRSAAAFGAHGVILPERRGPGMTPTAWRTSAGAAARLPIAQVTNLTRAIKQTQQAGFLVVGLDADAPTSVYDLEVAIGPLMIVVGSEGRGPSRLVAETCDLRVHIPMTTAVESLNAPVAAAVALAEVARRRSMPSTPRPSPAI
jgi:23S rRNA (guanosine2251-2'-O)-methyltransferase